MVTTIIRDGSIDSGNNRCQKYTSCQWLQRWCLLARRARNWQDMQEMHVRKAGGIIIIL